MKISILLIAIALSSCAINENGEKTFAGISGKQATNILLKTGKRIPNILKEEYEVEVTPTK